MGAIGRNEVELDPAPRPCQPSLHQLGVVVAGIVHKQMDQPLARIHRLDRPQQHDHADCIHRRRLDHTGLAGFEINRTVNVQTLPAAGLRHRKLRVFRRPAPHRPHGMRRMHRIAEQDRFIITDVFQQVIVTLDKSSLLVGVQLGRHRFRLAMLHLQPMQQCDQAGSALIGDAAFRLDPGADLTGCPRQRLGDPTLQLVLLRIAQAARAAVMAKARQAFDALVLIQPIPSADGVVVQQQDLRDIAAAHPVIQQHQRVGAPGRSVSHGTIATRVDQVPARFGVKEAGADHARTGIAAELIRKGLFRAPAESGYIYGAVIGAGLFAVLAAPFIGRLLPLFPPVVTGTIILVIGVSLMKVGINWAGGGLQTFTKVVDGTTGAFPNPAFGQLTGLGIALFVLIVILSLIKWGRGFVANVAVLLGIIAGAALAAALGLMHFEKVGTAPWFDVVVPFHFGVPQFRPIPIVTMCIVMVVVMIESLGMFLALGEITGKPIEPADLTRGLRADGVGTVLGGIFNTFPYTSFSQNVGLVGVTGVRSRFVTVAGGVIMLILGVLPKMSALVEAVPVVVLGGAGVVMFGMVAATGARILTGVDFKGNRYNLFVVAISVGFGMIPLVAPNFFQYTPEVLHPLLESGILLTAIVSVVLNLFFNGLTSTEAAYAETSAAAK